MDGLRQPAVLMASLRPKQLLGSIWYTTNQLYHAPQLKDRNGFWNAVDEIFSEREDYRVWRVVARSAHPSSLSDQWKNDLPSIVTAGIQSLDPIVAWGTFAVLALLRERQVPLFGTPVDVLLHLEAAFARLQRDEFSILPGLKAECALVELRLLDLYQLMQHSLGIRHTEFSVDEHVKRIVSRIKLIDSRWEPGRSISLREVHDTRRKYKDSCLLTEHLNDAYSSVAYAIYRSCFAFKYTITHLTDSVDSRSKLFAKLFRSAWLTQHTATAVLRASHGKRNRIRSEMDQIARELDALYSFSCSCRDAGEYLLSAVLGQLFFSLVPDVPALIEKYKKYADSIGWYIRAAGLSIDERFSVSFDPITGQSVENVVSLAIATEKMPATAANQTVDDKEFHPLNLRDLRLASDIATDPDWAVLKYSAYWNTTKPGLETIRNASYTAYEPLDEKPAQSALRLAVKYFLLSSAARLLNNTKQDLVDIAAFAKSLSLVSRINPLAIDLPTHLKWIKILKQAWSKHLDTQSLESTITLHEAVRGRILTAAKDYPFPRTLIAKLYDHADDEQLYHAINSVTSFKYPQHYPTKCAETAARKLNRQYPVAQSVIVSISLVSPILVNIVATNGNTWSDVASSTFQVAESLPATASKILSTQQHWPIKSDPVRYGGLAGVWWGQDFPAIARRVVELATFSGVRPSRLVLAIDPELGPVPWQHLFSNLDAEPIMVSIVPGLIWTDDAVASEKRAKEMNVTSCLQEDGNLVGLNAVINQQLARVTAPHSTSLLIVAGHGTVSASEHIPTISTSNDSITLSEWIDELSGRDSVLIHSCFGADARPVFLGDMGGVPGILLATGSRAVMASNVEVPVETAVTVQTVLGECLESNKKATLSDVHREAIRRDPRATLYTLFGVPSVPLQV